jgi:Phytanoyl-CoA dioxygenase (PhyH)
MTSRMGVMARKARSALRMAILAIYRLCGMSDFTWRYIANLRSSLEYPRATKKLSVAHERIVTELKRDGIAITSIGDFTENLSLFGELETAVRNYEISMAKEIEETRANAALQNRAKSYVLTLLGPVPTLDPSDIFVRFALQPEILGIVNSYFGMLTKLRSYNVWHNFPTHAPPRESQLWHRDPEDRCVLKMFVYLTDVNEGAGPLSYAPGTHSLGMVKTAAQSEIFREGRSYVQRSNDAQINKVVPKNQWITAIGPKGTIVFADTRGYHKGGLAVKRERILYTCMFTSNASSYPEVFKREDALPMYTDRSVAFAIEPTFGGTLIG